MVIRAAEADLSAGGADNVNMLAVGAGVAAAGLTAWLAQERDVEAAAIITEFEKTAGVHGHPNAPLVEMLKTLLTRSTTASRTGLTVRAARALPRSALQQSSQATPFRGRLSLAPLPIPGKDHA